MARDITKTKLKLEPHQVVLASVGDRKGLPQGRTVQLLYVRSQSDGRQGRRSARRSKSCSTSKWFASTRRTARVSRAEPKFRGTHQNLEEGHRYPGSRTPDRFLLNGQHRNNPEKPQLRWAVTTIRPRANMGIRRYKPITPGRRGASVSDFADLTPGAKPEKKPYADQAAHGRTKQPGQDHGSASWRRTQAGYRQIDFRRNKDGVPARGRTRSSTTRTAVPESPCCITWTARNAIFWLPTV